MRNPVIRSVAAITTILAVGASVQLPAAASTVELMIGAPVAPAFGPMIDDNASYEGQSKCSPSAKPGVVAFQQMVVAAYPDTGAERSDETAPTEARASTRKDGPGIGW